MTFVTDGSGITLGGTGISAATIALGTLHAFGGSVPAGVTFIPPAKGFFGVSTPFDVDVELSNSASPDYTLTAALQSSDAVNPWDIGGTDLTTSAQALTINGTCGQPCRTPSRLRSGLFAMQNRTRFALNVSPRYSFYFAGADIMQAADDFFLPGGIGIWIGGGIQAGD